LTAVRAERGLLLLLLLRVLLLLLRVLAWLEAGKGRRKACVLARKREEARSRAALSVRRLGIII
jgi:hypothetical protein